MSIWDQSGHLKSISSARDLTVSKLVLTLKRYWAMGMYLYPPAAFASELTCGITLLACGFRELMKRKNDCIESWYQQAPCGHRCQWSRWLTGIQKAEVQGRAWVLTIWWHKPPLNRRPPLLALTALTVFLKLKAPE
jgi:hypothetical protein